MTGTGTAVGAPGLYRWLSGLQTRTSMYLEYGVNEVDFMDCGLEAVVFFSKSLFRTIVEVSLAWF